MLISILIPYTNHLEDGVSFELLPPFQHLRPHQHCLIGFELPGLEEPEHHVVVTVLVGEEAVRGEAVPEGGDGALPLPPVQDSYSSNECGFRGRHNSLSTKRGSIVQQPSNFLIKPSRPCLNFTFDQLVRAIGQYIEFITPRMNTSRYVNFVSNAFINLNEYSAGFRNKAFP